MESERDTRETSVERGGGTDLSRWWQEHSELDGLVESLRFAMEKNSAAASAALEEFAEALETHFGVEEDVYFGLLTRLCPDLASKVEYARAAHGEVRADLDRVRAHLAEGRLDPAQESLRRLLDIFRDHERHEGQLIHELRERGL